MEHWNAIEPFPRYSVSTLGRVRNDKTGHALARSINQRGIVHVGLYDEDRIQHRRSVTLLVAHAFLPPHDEEAFDTPINLDGVRSNNCVENLTWRPRWFARRYIRQFEWEQKNPYLDSTRPVEEVYTGECFKTSWEAATKYGLLLRDLTWSITNHVHVWPTHQMFRVI
jgi:hypothetical protein